MLQQTMARVGGISIDPKPVLDDSARLLGYRNRALIPLRRDENGVLRWLFPPSITPHREHESVSGVIPLDHDPTDQGRLDIQVGPPTMTFTVVGAYAISVSVSGTIPVTSLSP